jgi:hypothetical protein
VVVLVLLPDIIPNNRPFCEWLKVLIREDKNELCGGAYNIEGKIKKKREDYYISLYIIRTCKKTFA